MNRFILNCFFVLIAMVAGVSMFLLKYEVIKEEEILYALQRQIKEDRWEIHTLKADWAHLTDPPRLRVLVDTYTTLQKINPEQVISFERIMFREMKLPKRKPVLSLLKKEP
ncbi:MAG: hypothetical protein J6U64_01070 [Alphaproteobacteria bacterium]|jgi:hypothetical protein|nr:hypothetical protein [Alphaproteobacteria bacterium]